MYFVANEDIISGGLPPRFTVSRSTIRNVVGLCDYYPVLPDFINQYIVPKVWNWYSYIDINATELVAAVRAINLFFSLSLVLFGIVNILLIYGDKSNRHSIIVMLAATCISWISFTSNSHFDRFSDRLSLLHTVGTARVQFGY